MQHIAIGELYGNTLDVEPPRLLLDGYAGVSVDHRRSHTLVRFAEPQNACSSALLNGGYNRVDQWLNLYVDKNTITDELPADTLQNTADAFALSGNTLGMMTSAKMKSLRILTLADGPFYFTAMVTSGLSNARRAGDPADMCLHAEGYGTGTINLLLLTNASLTPACQVEALMIASEAKAACLADCGVVSPKSRLPATGTGTDSIAVVSNPRGSALAYVGKHLSYGETLAKAVMQALSDTVQWETRFG